MTNKRSEGKYRRSLKEWSMLIYTLTAILLTHVADDHLLTRCSSDKGWWLGEVVGDALLYPFEPTYLGMWG